MSVPIMKYGGYGCIQNHWHQTQAEADACGTGEGYSRKTDMSLKPEERGKVSYQELEEHCRFLSQALMEAINMLNKYCWSKE